MSSELSNLIGQSIFVQYRLGVQLLSFHPFIVFVKEKRQSFRDRLCGDRTACSVETSEMIAMEFHRSNEIDLFLWKLWTTIFAVSGINSRGTSVGGQWILNSYTYYNNIIKAS